jgi:predicted enzyme related to lactoylglutathione lyase
MQKHGWAMAAAQCYRTLNNTHDRGQPMSAKDEAECPPAYPPKHGQVCYLQIPSLDLVKSATFYENLFGWGIEPPSSFEAPDLIGQWVTDRAPAPDAGPLIWIDVDHIDDTLKSVPASGGEVVAPPSPDGPRWLATIRDPAGNLIGIVQHKPR